MRTAGGDDERSHIKKPTEVAAHLRVQLLPVACGLGDAPHPGDFKGEHVLKMGGLNTTVVPALAAKDPVKLSRESHSDFGRHKDLSDVWVESADPENLVEWPAEAAAHANALQVPLYQLGTASGPTPAYPHHFSPFLFFSHLKFPLPIIPNKTTVFP